MACPLLTLLLFMQLGPFIGSHLHVFVASIQHLLSTVIVAGPHARDVPPVASTVSRESNGVTCEPSLVVEVQLLSYQHPGPRHHEVSGSVMLLN